MQKKNDHRPDPSRAIHAANDPGARPPTPRGVWEGVVNEHLELLMDAVDQARGLGYTGATALVALIEVRSPFGRLLRPWERDALAGKPLALGIYQRGDIDQAISTLAPALAPAFKRRDPSTFVVAVLLAGYHGILEASPRVRLVRRASEPS